MSNRNSLANKTAARERLRAEREQQAKKAKIRRQFVVGGAVLGVLALGGGIAYAVVQLNKPAYWAAAADAKLVKPANSSGKNGTTVVLGGADAKNTVDVYEDMRCPACAQFEQQLGETVQKGADDGDYKLQVHLGQLIDGNFGGEGSRNAASALGAALNVSTAAMADYKTLLYSAKWHPEESEDKFADDAYLIKVAQNVKALKDNEKFQAAVKDGTYDKWALTMIDSFESANISGTPTVRIDGKDIETANVATELAKLGK